MKTANAPIRQMRSIATTMRVGIRRATPRFKPFATTSPTVSSPTQIDVYARNLFDQRVAIFAQANRVGGVAEYSLATPRTVGLGVRGTF